MNTSRLPWWVWVVGIFLLMGTASRVAISIIPLLILGFVIFKVVTVVTGVGTSPPARPPGQRRVGPRGGPADLRPGHGHSPAGSWSPSGTWSPSGDLPSPDMPTIDVPRYPGGPTGTAGGDEPPLHAAPGQSPAGPPGPEIPRPSAGPDPVVSLAQLHLARSARDLQAAVERGSATEVSRVLDEISDLSSRMQTMLGASSATAGTGRQEFTAGLRALDRLVEEARGEDPPAEKVGRVVWTSRRMGETGRHE